MPEPDPIDVRTPNVARMYDYFLGGKDNFEADRAAAEEVTRFFDGYAGIGRLGARQGATR